MAGVAPDETVAAPEVFPVAWDDWSTAANPAAGDSPAYSSTPSPMSADDVGVTVTVSGPPPLVTGAVQTTRRSCPGP